MCLWCSVEGMSAEEVQEKALGVAQHTLGGKSDLERAAVLHQHIGRRAMGDMVIETFEPSPGESVHLPFIWTLKLKNKDLVASFVGYLVIYCQQLP